MQYRVELAPSAQRDIRRLSEDARRLLERPILALGQNPRSVSARKLRGQERAWRLRVGPFRIIYDIYDDRSLVVVLKVVRRGESTYRRI
ncbi:MAG: type II toxin-antitoxin system RelE/ParE family toxin [Chloroflexi bacterium]|nr:type II toxin-antitoxin system RelE/ParE family toxin [Chloroflexota bacterium]